VPFELTEVVPWGRSFEEYLAMFDLSGNELSKRILGCGDGPAAFNAGLTKRGGSILSVDPLYAASAADIRARIAQTYETVMDQVRKNPDQYSWEVIRSVEQLGRVRLEAMETFLCDYENGICAGRYRQGELPSLPFEDNSFDIALSSHFLFLYSAQLSEEFHLNALSEMLRVAREVRVFPLLSLDGRRAPYVTTVATELAALGFRTEIRPVAYEFQRGANEMFRAVRPEA
jgi:hypothetical protein